MTQEDTAKQLWIQFRDELVRELNSTLVDAFTKAWSSTPERTRFYRHDIFPRVALQLGLELQAEWPGRIDFAMVKPAEQVPLAIIESENDARSAVYNEIPKLCCFAGPLKAFLTCDEWDETPGVWSHGGRRSRHLNAWAPIIRAHATAWPQPSVLSIIAAEWNNSNWLTFYALVFDCRTGGVWEPVQADPEKWQDSVIFQRNMRP